MGSHPHGGQATPLSGPGRWSNLSQGRSTRRSCGAQICAVRLPNIRGRGRGGPPLQVMSARYPPTSSDPARRAQTSTPTSGGAAERSAGRRRRLAREQRRSFENAGRRQRPSGGTLRSPPGRTAVPRRKAHGLVYASLVAATAHVEAERPKKWRRQQGIVLAGTATIFKARDALAQRDPRRHGIETARRHQYRAGRGSHD
jgi:hypothetical protein